MNGYGGSILRVNLTEGKCAKSPTPADLAREYIGGRGFGAWFLFNEVPVHADPLGPDNKVIVSSGPLSGLMIPGAGKCDWTTKSPLTGGYASASLGGHFTAELKYAGIDSIIFEGMSAKPVYLFIDDDKIELRDAAEYWGRGCIELEKHFKDQFGEDFQVAVIGPGSENGVLFGCVNHDYGREAGRGGVGHCAGCQKDESDCYPGHQIHPGGRSEGLPRGGDGDLQGLQGVRRIESLAGVWDDDRSFLV